MNLQTPIRQHPYLSKLFLKMQYACGVQFDPVSNHGSERISFWRQLYKPSAPLRVLLSALKASFAIHQLFAGGMSQHLCVLLTAPPHPPMLLPERFAVPGRSCLLQHALLAGCAICSRKVTLSHLWLQYAPMTSIFLSLLFSSTWPELILSLSASHLDQIPLQLLILALHLPASLGTLQSQCLKTTLSVQTQWAAKEQEEWTTFQGNSTAESPPSKNAPSCLQEI